MVAALPAPPDIGERFTSLAVVRQDKPLVPEEVLEEVQEPLLGTAWVLKFKIQLWRTFP